MSRYATHTPPHGRWDQEPKDKGTEEHIKPRDETAEVGRRLVRNLLARAVHSHLAMAYISTVVPLDDALNIVDNIRAVNARLAVDMQINTVL